MEQFICLSGLPRAGSTLLSAILSQNPLLHAEGNSAVCQLMWDMHTSCSSSAKEQLIANKREKTTVHALISQIPQIYYKDAPEKIIIDKCRSWTIEANIALLQKYVDKDYKIIILERSVVDIVKSFVKLYRANGITGDIATKLLQPNSEPIMRSIMGINKVKKNNRPNHYLFIQYTDLINDPEQSINKIYAFCGWAPFAHNFKKVDCKYPEADEVYGLKGMHKIHPTVGQRENPVVLTPDILAKCEKIDKLMGYFPQKSE
jgi:sulfotransferase